MAPGLPYALAALVLYGLGDVVYKRAAQSGVPAHRFVMAQAWCFLACVGLYGAATGALGFAPAALWGMAAGLFIYTGFYNFARSLQGGAVSVVAAIYRMSFVVTAAGAIALLGEPLTALKLAGLACALAAAWLLLASGRRGAAPLPREALVRVCVATVSLGIAGLLYKVALLGGARPALVLTLQAVVVVPLATAVAAWRDGRVKPGATALGYGAVAAVVLASAFMLMLESLRYGEASVMVPIAQMGFVVAALIGVVVLREPLSARGALGLALAVGALASLAAA